MPFEPTPRVVVLGDRGAGKTSLLRAAGFRTAAASTDGTLECECVEPAVGGECVDVWDLAGGQWVGGPDHTAIMHAAVTLTSPMLFVVVLDLSRPTLLLERGRAWLELLDARVGEACTTAASAEPRLGADAEAAATEACKHDAMRAEIERVWRQQRALWLLRLASTTGAEPLAADMTAASVATREEDAPGDDSHPPLPEGVLRRNVGVPLLLVGSKWDRLLASRPPLPLLDLVKFQLRDLALECGARLITTAVPPAPPGASRPSAAIHAELFADAVRAALRSSPAREVLPNGTRPHGTRVDAVVGIEASEPLHIPLGWDSPLRLASLSCATVADLARHYAPNAADGVASPEAPHADAPHAAAPHGDGAGAGQRCWGLEEEERFLTSLASELTASGATRATASPAVAPAATSQRVSASCVGGKARGATAADAGSSMQGASATPTAAAPTGLAAAPDKEKLSAFWKSLATGPGGSRRAAP